MKKITLKDATAQDALELLEFISAAYRKANPVTVSCQGVDELISLYREKAETYLLTKGESEEVSGVISKYKTRDDLSQWRLITDRIRKRRERRSMSTRGEVKPRITIEEKTKLRLDKIKRKVKGSSYDEVIEHLLRLYDKRSKRKQSKPNAEDASKKKSAQRRSSPPGIRRRKKKTSDNA